jgi:glyoxylase-like metal-dependent hydrolase (beta-lactamase superfamily II)
MTIRLDEVGDRIWLASPDANYVVSSNSVVIDTGGELIVVDTHSRPSDARAAIRQLTRSIDLPVRAVVNTHAHWDHWFGNQAYAQLPQAPPIVAAPGAHRSQSRDHGLESQAERQALLEHEIRTLDGRLSTAHDPAQVARLRAWRRDALAYRRELSSMRPFPATEPTARLTIEGSLRRVEVIHPGRGHTDGDLVVWCERGAVLATGDLVNGWIPFMGDSYPADWVVTLDAIRGLHPQVILPGHGAPADAAWLDLFRGYVLELVGAVRETLTAGLDLDDARLVIRDRLRADYQQVFDSRGGALRPWNELVLDNIEHVSSRIRRLEAASIGLAARP